MGRYISSNEAIWHILSFPIHERDPAVEHLAIHLENGQRVYFTEENVLQRAFEAPKTTLTEFFTLCQKPDVFGQFAKTLVYGDVPRYFTWNKSSKKWEPRKQGNPHPSITGIFKAKTLGRLYTVHPKQRECFYLRLLLVNVPGPTSFEFLRTVNGRVFNTYQDACRELQLLEDDNHWDLTLADAALTSTPNNIRQLFAIILTTCYPSQAQTLWEKYKNCMTEDILHRIRQTNQSQNIDYTPEMYNEALVLIEDLCVLISNLPLNHYGMPSPNRPATDLVNTDLQRENQYDHGSLATIIMNSEPLLTAEQKIIYDRIMLAVAAEQGGFFFLGCTRWNRQRAILAAKNVDVDEINFQIQQLLPGDLMSFKSIDTVVDENESVNFPIEFLNSLDIPGMPPHNLRLKIGSPIILLRNLNPPQLCNGTRLVIKKITGNILEATILAGKFKGKVVLLPRIPMIPSDSTIPFKRLQFPIRLAFAMSINKSQGQTMSICGLDLENPCFSHGQLYVACSRVGKPSNLFVLAKDSGHSHEFVADVVELQVRVLVPLKNRRIEMHVKSVVAARHLVGVWAKLGQEGPISGVDIIT
ncbi:ATP-dependent DNA helicase [Trichonephila clavipes]|nr:ATP-dependent DNA helicase [Trichonephila clavipes]